MNYSYVFAIKVKIYLNSSQEGWPQLASTVLNFAVES